MRLETLIVHRKITSTSIYLSAVLISASHPGVCERTESAVCWPSCHCQQQAASQRTGSHSTGGCGDHF